MKNYVLLFVCMTFLSFASMAQLMPLAGTMGACVGANTFLTESDSALSGGTWSSSNIAVATVAGLGAAGEVYGVSPGTSTITYAAGGSAVSAVVTITAAPAAITGATPTCVGSTGTLSDVTAGGVWSSSDASAATVSATGVVTAVATGSAEIYYTVATGCYASISYYVPSFYSMDSVSGPSLLCTGASGTFSEAITGGAWSSGDPTVATIDPATGVATGVSAGTVTLSYTVASSCSGSGTATTRLTVLSSTSAGAISGPSSVIQGGSIRLADGTGSGTWGSSNTAVATTFGGLVTGVSAGTATITYTMTTCGGTPYTTTTITVNALDGISGYVNFSSGSSYDTAEIWLITYNPATMMLEAVDSITTVSASNLYYQFTGVTTDSYRVKAAVVGDSISSTGYVPTYDTGAYYWHDANAIYHVSGTANTNVDIDMAIGTVTSGPGFIGGNVTSGANRGTGPAAPVVGQLVFLQNAGTGALVQQSITDASGNYSFSNLPYGTYFVYPELINYATTPYTGITLSASSPGVTGASFVKHTVSLTITPVSSGVAVAARQEASVIVYPNPTSGKVSLLWTLANAEAATVTITDIAGRQVYNNTLQLAAGTASRQLDLSGQPAGAYIISIRSASLSYNGMIELER